MKLINSEEHKPEDQVKNAINDLRNETQAAIDKLKKDVASKTVVVESKLNHLEFTEMLTNIFDKALTRLENVDRHDYIAPIIEELNALRTDIGLVKGAINEQKLDPKIDVKVAAPDITKIEKAINTLPSVLNAMVQGIDVMEREELAKNFKEIIKLLTDISAMGMVSQGTTILGGGGSEVDTSALSTHAKQDTQITEAQSTNTNLGAKADTAASTDTGTFSLIALTKRIAQWLTTIAGYNQSLAGTVNGSEIQTDIVAPLPAGTNNIGDVDVASLPGVAGDVASGSADSGNPVKIGGRNNSTLPTLSDGQRGDLQLGTRGSVRTELWSANSSTALHVVADNADAVTPSATARNLQIVSRNSVFNGTNWDRMRGDTNGTLVEQRFSYSRKTADGQVKASAGFVHSVSIAPTTATPTAGLLTIYDNTAESGTVIYSEWVPATTEGHTVILDVVAATGIYAGFDATLANIQVTVSYR